MRVAAVATRSLGIDTAARRSRRRRVLLEHLVFLQQFCDRRSDSLMRRRRHVPIARDGNDGALTLQQQRGSSGRAVLCGLAGQ